MDNVDSDCYFFIDMDTEVAHEEDRVIRVLCVECHDVYYPEVGWFYAGSEQGYGPWEYLCHNCKKHINFMETSEEKFIKTDN